jgi:hypothetical protein
LDGDGSGTIFKVTNPNLNITIENVTFKDGRGSAQGAALSFATAINCKFINNRCVGDSSSYGGAAFFVNAINCTFEGNYGSGGYGGALAYGTAVNCIFKNNHASSRGGAAYNITAINCTFEGNHALGGYGGAMASSNAINCKFIDNVADKGGALANSNATNCYFYNNSATKYFGGAMSHFDWTPFYALNSTFINNTAETGSAINGGKSILCIFENNNCSDETDIVPVSLVASNFTSSPYSGERFTFNLTDGNENYYGYETIIDILQDDNVIKSVSLLSGESWLVDLPEGNYKAIIGINWRYAVTPLEVRINITKGYGEMIHGDNFISLWALIGLNPGEYKLTRNFTFNATADFDFTEGIRISGDYYVLDGDGYTIDAGNQAQVFCVTGNNVVLKNINFINGNATKG